MPKPEYSLHPVMRQAQQFIERNEASILGTLQGGAEDKAVNEFLETNYRDAYHKLVHALTGKKSVTDGD